MRKEIGMSAAILGIATSALVGELSHTSECSPVRFKPIIDWEHTPHLFDDENDLLACPVESGGYMIQGRDSNEVYIPDIDNPNQMYAVRKDHLRYWAYSDDHRVININNVDLTTGEVTLYDSFYLPYY